jgi:hypothetical protein
MLAAGCAAIVVAAFALTVSILDNGLAAVVLNLLRFVDP